MSRISSRKHSAARQTLLSGSVALTTLALGIPAAALAQSSTQTLPEVEVKGLNDANYKTDNASNIKFTAPLVDTPKSVSVIPAEVLRETNATTLKEALRTVPGITFGTGEGGNPEGDRPFLRGFDAQTSTFIDGLRDPSSQSRDMFNIEQIDVVKGPDSAFSGAGAVGGSINLTTKQARLGNFGDVGLGLGTDSYKRGTLDLNRQLGEHVAMRLNLMREKSDVAGRDAVFVDRLGAAFSLGLGLGTPTRALIDFYHFESDDMPDYGHPYNNPFAATSPNAVFNGDGGPLRVDRNNFYGLNARDFRNTDADALTLNIAHDLDARWTLRNRTRLSRTLNDYVVTNPGDSSGLNITDTAFMNGGGLVEPGFLRRSQKSRHSTTTAVINATELVGEFEAGGVKHQIAAGIEFSQLETDSRGYTVTGFSAANIANPNPNDPWLGSIERATAGNEIETRTQGIYLFDTVTLNPQWMLNLGARWDRFKTSQTPYTTDDSAPNAANFLDNSWSFWSYQAGVVYKPAPNGSVYLNLASSANPSGVSSGDGSENLSATNRDLEPEETRSIELGTKWNLLDNRLGLSAAVFHMEKTNAKVTVAPGVLDTAGEQQVRGIELGVSGKITDNWQAFGGYTYLDSELTDPGPLSSDKGNRFPNTPRHSFSLWTSYTPLPRLEIGGGAFYMSKVYGNTANTKWVPSYWRFDAMASYAVNKDLSLRLNVQNLFDKTYYDRAYSTHMVSVAPGRQVTLTANLRF